MPHRAKRYRADLSKIERGKIVPLEEGVEKLKAFAPTRFDQTVEMCMHLGIDPRQADQLIRGSVSLPHGIGKSKRVIAFCQDDTVAAAKEAGAVEAGGEDLVKKIEDGWMDFEVAIASPDMMRVVSRLGRVLGPRGLMPSPKSGTVTKDVAQAVQEYAAGKVEFRNDDGGNVHGVVGKLSFEPQKLVENAQAFHDHIVRMRPSTAKGQFVKKVSLSATMTPGITVEL